MAGPRSETAAPAPRPWSLGVRAFHWSLACLFAVNFLVLEEGTLHEWVGCAVAGLLAFRLLYGLVGPRRARFASFLPSLAAAKAHLRDLLAWRPGRAHGTHNPLGALMICNLLLSIAAICLTGWLMTTDAFWGVEWVEEVHEIAANWAAISVLAHVAGVAAECLRAGPGVLGDMLGPWAERRILGRAAR